MKLFLFGGAEIDKGQFFPQLKLLEQVILECKPRQVLHIPYARPKAMEVEWEGDWFNQHINLKDIEYLNPERPGDMEKVDEPLVFLSGGGGNVNLLNKIKSNKKLFDLVMKSKYLIGESAGAKILGTYFRTQGSDPNSPMMSGLDIVKDTVIEPHYTERNRQELLLKDMKETGVKYGLGVDCLTVAVFQTESFPSQIDKIGGGGIELKNNLGEGKIL